MEKIKSVLHGHKNDDTMHDAPATSAATHHAEGEHPIYDQMTGSSTAQPGATGTAVSAGQTGTSTGLGQSEKTGTPAPSGVHSANVGDASRSGAGFSHDALSGASIKSGVIGFGSDQQGHAALPSHNQNEANHPEANLGSKQVLGGGSTAPGPTNTDIPEQPSTLNSANPPLGTSTIDQPRSNVGNTGVLGDTESSTTRQPFDSALRQESYTNDTDRSFPLAGGVASKHDPAAAHHTSSTAPLAQQSTSTHNPITSEREPGTKEKEAGVRDGHGREALAGAAAAATAIGATAHHKDMDAHDRDLASREAPLASSTTHNTQGHNPDALAAATAAAATAKSSSTPSSAPGAHDTSLAGATRAHEASSTAEPEDPRYVDPGRPPGGRKLSYRHVPGGYPSPTPDESKTFLFYRDQIVPEPGATEPVIDHAPSKRHSGQHDPHHSPESSKGAPLAAAGAGGLAGGLVDSHAAGDKSTAGPHESDTLDKLDPKVDSDLDGSGIARSTPSTQRDTGLTTTPAVAGADTSAAGQHELRHTGSLEQPTPRSSEHADDHHYGRDAAIAGGVGAGAAGLGYAATHKRDKSPDVARGALPEETSPYSSRQLDPRVLGSQGKLDEQKFDPQSKHEPTSHHAAPATAAAAAPVAAAATHEHHSTPTETEKSSAGPHKSSLLNKLDPRVKNDSAEKTDKSRKAEESKDHHGRDAALIGGGAATAAGVHHSLQRNDTPGTGTAVLPEEQRLRAAEPLASSTTSQSHPVADTSAPVTGTSAPVAGTSAPVAGTSAPVTETTSSVPVSEQDSKTSAHLPTSGYEHPHPASTKKYEPYQGPMTTDGTPFYGTAGAPAPVVEGQPKELSKQGDDHHHGRDAALVGAGAATAGGLAYASQKDHQADTGPASNTLGPHSSNTANVLDPKVQPDPSKQIHHNVGPTAEDPASKTIGPHSSNVANVLDPRVQPDPSKQKGHTTTGSHQSDTLNRADPKVDEKQHHYGRDAAIAGGAGAAGYGAYEAMNAYGDHRSTQPSAAMGEQRYDTTASGARAPNPVPAAGHYDYNDDHTKRNAALGTGAGLGAGALGGAAYAGGKHGDHAQAPVSGTDSPVHPTQGTIAPQNTHMGSTGPSHAPHDSVQEPLDKDKDHSKRNAALAGTAGAAAAGGAAYAYNDKDQKKLEKEHEKEAKKLEKEREKEEHKLEKEREKEARRHSKELEKESSTPEKKHGILGFLHRDKSKKEKKSSADSSPRQSGEVRRSVDNKRHSKEYAAGGAALGAGAAAAAYDDDSSNPDSPRWKGKNKLHKDPPKGHPAREAMEHHEMGEMQGKHEHMGVDGPIGNPNAISGMHQTQHNVYGAEPAAEAIGQDHNKITEPHTGLPMNVGRFGDGHGGTDANPTVHGHHEGAGAQATDWDAVKKANTPY